LILQNILIYKIMESICSQLLEIVQKELENDDNKVKSKVLDPLVKYLGKHLMPYVLMTAIFASLLFIMLIYLTFVTHKLRKLQ
jgi:hypothetical protein